MRKILLAMAAAVLLGVVPAAAEASCSITGTLVRARFKDDAKTGSHVLYLRDNVTDTFYYTVKTKDDEMAALAATLAAQQTRVKVKGSVSDCPTPPATGGVSIGKVVELFVAP